MKWEAEGDGFKITINIVDARGPLHTEVIAKYDGKDYPVMGSRTANGTRAFRRIDQRTHETVTKVGGRVTGTAITAVSPDGKTMTITSPGSINGSVRVYDKQ